MFQKGDYIIYRKNVCIIEDVKEKLINNMDYYVLKQPEDDSLTLRVPTNNKYIRGLMSKQDVKDLINRIVDIKIINCDNKVLENEYKKLLLEGSHDNLVKIIKTTYLRNKDRLDHKKKISEKDNNYFLKAEHYLYSEIAAVLGIDYDEAREYVINKVKAIEEK